MPPAVRYPTRGGRPDAGSARENTYSYNHRGLFTAFPTQTWRCNSTRHVVNDMYDEEKRKRQLENAKTIVGQSYRRTTSRTTSFDRELNTCGDGVNLLICVKQTSTVTSAPHCFSPVVRVCARSPRSWHARWGDARKDREKLSTGKVFISQESPFHRQISFHRDLTF